MLRNFFLINSVLVIIIALLGLKLYGVLTESVELPPEVSVADDRPQDYSYPLEDNRINDASFQVINAMDLFRPSRTAPSKKDTAQTKTAGPKDKPRLFGTIILNDEKKAILEDPGTKATRLYRVNDSVAGFVVSDIMEDKVVLLQDGEKIEVRLREEKTGIAATKPRITPPRAKQSTPRQAARTRRTRRRRPTPPRQGQTQTPQTPPAPAPPTGSPR